MPKISEMLAALKNADQPIEDMDAFIKSVEDAHTEEVSIRDAKVKQMEDTVAGKDELVNQLKIKNYDLITQIPAVDPDDNKRNDDTKPETITGVDSFFTTD